MKNSRSFKSHFLWLQWKIFFSYYFVFDYYCVYLSIACKVFTIKATSLACFTFWTMFYNDDNMSLLLLNDLTLIIVRIVFFEILPIKYFRLTFKCLSISFTSSNMLKKFFIRVNSNKHTTKFFFNFSLFYVFHSQYFYHCDVIH